MAETHQEPGRSGWRDRANFNTVAALAFTTFGVLLLVIIPYQIDEPLIALAEDENNLVASFFPTLVASGLVLLGIWFFFKSFSIRQRNDLLALDREAIVNVVVSLAAMAVYGVLMMFVGFVLASTLLIAFLATFYGNRNYYVTAAVSIIIPIAIFYTFTKLLATYLPPFPIDSFFTRYSIL